MVPTFASAFLRFRVRLVLPPFDGTPTSLDNAVFDDGFPVFSVGSSSSATAVDAASLPFDGDCPTCDSVSPSPPFELLATPEEAVDAASLPFDGDCPTCDSVAPSPPFELLAPPEEAVDAASVPFDGDCPTFSFKGSVLA